MNKICSLAAELSFPLGAVNVNLILAADSSYDVLSVLMDGAVLANVIVDAAIVPTYLSSYLRSSTEFGAVAGLVVHVNLFVVVL